MATEELLTVSEDEILRARYEYTLKNELDWQSGITNARRAGYEQAAMEYDEKIQEKDAALREKDEKIRALEQELRQTVQKSTGLESEG